MVFLILVISFFLLLPIFLLVNVIRLHRRIDRLEEFLEIKPVRREPIERIEEIPEKPELEAEKPVKNWELELGRKYFYWIGIFIFLLGIAFFLKYAFENRWFNEVVRVIIGLVSGVFFVYGGNRLINRYRQFSLGLFGIGIVIFYLSFYTANNFYHIIPYPAAFFMMVLITVLCVVLTLVYDSMFLAFVALAGGFLTPVILRGPVVPLLTAFFGLSGYLFLLNTGFLILSTLKPWKIISILTAVFTYSIFSLWLQEFYTAQFFSGVFGSITVFFLLYLVFTLSKFNTRNRIKELEFLMVFLNSAGYAGFAFYLIHSVAPDFKGLISIALALVHTLAAVFYRRTSYKDENLVLFLLGTALVFLTIAFPLYLKNTYITIAWVCEGLVIFWIGLRISSVLMRVFGYLLYLLAICRFLAYDTQIQYVKYASFLNERFFTGILIAICLFLTSALLFKRFEKLPLDEKRFPVLLAGIANVFLFILLTEEVIDACKNIASRFFEQMILSISWALYGGVLLAMGLIFRSKMARYFALTYLGVATFKVIFFDLFLTGKVYRIVISIVTGIILIIVGFVYHRKKEV